MSLSNNMLGLSLFYKEKKRFLASYLGALYFYIVMMNKPA
ncbi:hypothetical protein HMPREF3203_01803 [Proteus mirabilis]|nr:hypothetical protein HMPREF3203_01803 [Proteus mirabilis]